MKRPIIKSTLMLLCLLLVPLGALAQGVLKGVVSDANGEPVIGASVTVVGNSKHAAITDANGAFSINVPAKSGKLEVTYIGMLPQTVAYSDGKKVSVVLKEDTQMLNDVVVIGYGSVKRRDLTGAVTSVKGEEIAANPVSNVAQALQGKLSGVNVTSEDGRPGAAVNIRVRGGGSITQSNDPLFVVDGFPVSSISDIPASDIETIDVLKDASSTAIYGARGANGVILITTKSGQAGKTRVTYDAYVQTKHVAKTIKTLSAQDYVYWNWSYAATRGQAFQDAQEKYFGLGSKYGNHYADYANVATHDYTDDLLRTAWSHSHNVNISGGNDRTKISANLSYVNDQGIKINSDYQRFNGDFKLKHQLLRNLTFDADIHYSESTLNGDESSTSGKGSNVSGAYLYRPIDNPLGGVDYTEVASGFSFGVANIDGLHDPDKIVKSIHNENFNRSLRGAMALTWEIIPGLTARSEVSLLRNDGKRSYYNEAYVDGPASATATLTRSTGKTFREVTTLNYNFKAGEIHNFNVLLGQEILNSTGENSTLSGRGYPKDYDMDKAMGLIQTATEQFSASNSINVPNRTTSFFGRVGYNLLDRYLLTATMRADGSSKFGPNNRWGYFPAAAAAWRISEESFMAGTRSWLDNLKLRLSIGTSGTDNISSDLWRETWRSLGIGSNSMPINGEKLPYYAPAGLLANPDLKWETTISRNLGIDFAVLGSRINGSIEFYWNTTKDLLMAVPIDNTTGYSYQFQNFGKTSNRGVEISLNADIIRNKDLRFNAGIIYNYNRNKLDEMTNADQYLYSSYWGSVSLVPNNDYMLVEGKSIGVVRGFKANGFYTTADFDYVNGQYKLKAGIPDLTKSVTQTYQHHFSLPEGQVAFPGAPKFHDQDGNMLINEDDAVELGEVQARHTGAINLNLNYKNFDVSANFNYQLGGLVYNATAMRDQSGQEQNGFGIQRAEWTKDCYRIYDVNDSGDLVAVSDPAALDKLNAGAKYHTPYHQSGICSDEWLEDASYLRLQTLTVGYTLPKQITAKVGVERCRFYFTANNLFTITGYSGLDPEVNASATGRTGFMSDLRIFPTLNMDFGAYPRARTFTLGANIVF